MQSIRKHWSATLDATEPELDLDRSRKRFVERFSGGARRGTRPRAIRLVLSLAALVAGVVALVVAWPAIGPSRVGPQPGDVLAKNDQPLDFADGSRVLVHGGSLVHLHSVDPQGARVELEQGELSASIVHREDTHWTFLSGPFTVEVTGTKLWIDWKPATKRFEVSVQKGSVRVTGPMLEGGRSVTAGQRCRVDIPQARLEVTPTEAAQTNDTESTSVQLEDLPLASSSSPSAPSSADAVAGPSWIELEQAARWKEAMAAAERQGLTSIYATASSDQLMALARAARLSGHGDKATRALLTCRERFPGSPAAAQAAFLLGRAAAPATAARWLAQYLQEAPSGPFAREAAGRLIEAYSQAGNQAAARQAASVYLQRYPNGPHAAFARSIIVASRDEE